MNFKTGCVFFLCLATAILNGYFFDWLNDSFFHYSSDENGLQEFSGTAQFFIIVIIAPIVETALFNWTPNFLLSGWSVKNTALLILIPSLVFAACHLYHPLYSVMAFAGGLIMNAYFLYNKKTHKPAVAFLLVAILHGAYNLYGYLFVV